MTRIARLLAGIACLSFAMGVSSQEAEAPHLKLRVKETIPLQLQSGPFLPPFRCDSDGSIYFRRTSPLVTFNLPLQKFKSDGKAETPLNLLSVSGYEKGEFSDFAVDYRGRVHMLAAKPPGVATIVIFARDGTFESEKALGKEFSPAKIAIFRSGEYLVSGLKAQFSAPGQKEDLPDQPFTAIFSSSGEKIADVTLPEDEKLSGEMKGDDVSNVSSSVSLGAAEGGDDGNIYFRRGAASPLIYVLSPAGTIVRKFRINPPQKGYVANTMKYSGGKIVQEFYDDNATGNYQQVIFVVVDAQTGEQLAQYWTTPEVRGSFACYSANGFTLVSSNEKHELRLLRTYPTNP